MESSPASTEGDKTPSTRGRRAKNRADTGDSGGTTKPETRKEGAMNEETGEMQEMLKEPQDNGTDGEPPQDNDSEDRNTQPEEPNAEEPKATEPKATEPKATERKAEENQNAGGEGGAIERATPQQGGELAEVEPTGYLAIDMEDPTYIAGLIAENLGENDSLSIRDLTRITVPGRGATLWSLQGPEGEEAVKTLNGIIVFRQDTRAYWQESLEEATGTSRPDCHSMDNITGYGSPGGSCRSCDLNVFGSAANGKGKACKEKKLIFLLEEDKLLPMVVQAPSTSLTPMRDYFVGLTTKYNLPFWGAVTELALRKVDDDPFPYSVITPRLVRPMLRGQFKRLEAYVRAMEPRLRQIAVAVENEASNLRQPNGATNLAQDE